MSSDLFKFKVPVGRPDTATPVSDRSTDSKLVLTDEVFKNLRDVIYVKSGIYFTEGKKYLLEGRIAKRVIANRMNTFDEYVTYLSSPRCTKEELYELYEAVTINETYFFRGDQQIEAFEKIIVPELIKRKVGTSNVFRVWSAASSTGEEAYTLAMVILEKLKPMFPHVQFQILASDINKAVLESAKAGIFKEYAIRNIPSPYLTKYFKKQGSLYILSEEVKRMVKLANINLYDKNQMRAVVNCDVIFCCNVLIYFDIPSKQQVVSYLYDALNPGGYLFIGYSESLHGVSKAFKLVHLPKAMAYKKE